MMTALVGTAKGEAAAPSPTAASFDEDTDTLDDTDPLPKGKVALPRVVVEGGGDADSCEDTDTLGETRPYHARDDVGAATGREGYQHADRFGREFFGGDTRHRSTRERKKYQ